MSEILFEDPKEYILLEYQLRKNRRPAYSMRAFARDLDFSPSSLNDFLKNRVGMSEKRIFELANRLHWSSERALHFTDLIVSRFGKDPSERQNAAMRIKLRIKDKASYFDIQQFRIISTWYHLVIIELCHMRDHLAASDIGKLIDIPASQAKKALHDLQSLGILKDTAKGLKPTSETFQFGDSAPSEAIQNFHLQILQQAQNALFQKDMNQRESHSLVFSIHHNDRAQMNKEIRKALYQIINKYAVKSSPDAVQIVSLQSFEVTHLNKSN